MIRYETLDALVERFEAVWQAGRQPDVADFLQAAPENCDALLVDLVNIDLEYRLKSGFDVAIEDYVLRFPPLAADRDAVLDLIESEVSIRRRMNPGLAIAEYCERFPSYQAALLQRLALDTQDDNEPGTTRLPDGPEGAGSEAAGSAAEARPSDAEQRPTGVRLDDYELIEEIGRGGMGIVYRARQVTLARDVAVKTMKAGVLASPEQVRRFRREARAAGRLKHPHIVPVFNYGVAAGRHYLVMEYVAGRSLETAVREAPWAPRRAARLVAKAARAIQYSHLQGVLHRDIKPSNVLVSDDDEPHVTDFGLAKATRLAANTQDDEALGTLDSESLTAGDAGMGTPAYMPPEQIRGGPLTPAGDVYGLGATLYELLVGRPPFQAATAPETFMLVLSQEPVSTRTLNAKIDRDLDTICMKCLEKEPRRRYQTPGDLAADLERFLDGKPTLARPAGPAERLVRWCRRNPSLAVLWGTIALSLILITAVASAAALVLDGMRHNLQAAVDDKDDALQAAERANAEAAATTDRLQRQVYAHALREVWGEAWWGGGRMTLDDEDQCPRRLHDFTWRFLQRSLQRNDLTVDLTGTGVDKVVWSADGHRIATAGADGRVRVWDATGMLLVESPADMRLLGSLAISPDGETIAIAPEGFEIGRFKVTDIPSVVWIWDVTANVVQPLATRQIRINCLAFTPDGRFLACGNLGADAPKSHQVVLYDVETRERVAEMVHERCVVGLDIAPDGRHLAAATTADGVFRCQIWPLDEVLAGGSPTPFTIKSGAVRQMAFSADSKTLITADRSGRINLWDHHNALAAGSRKSNIRDITGLVALSDDKFAVGGTDGKRIFIYSTTDAAYRLQLDNRIAGMVGLAASPGGEFIVSIDKDEALRFWNTKRIPRPARYRQRGGAILSLAIDKEDGRLATADGSGAIRVSDVATCEDVATPLVPESDALSVAFSPDGDWLVAGCQSGDVLLYSVPDFEMRKTLSINATPHRYWRGISSVAFSREGSHLAASHSGGLISIWETDCFERVRDLHIESTGGVSGLAFSPVRNTLAAVSMPGAVLVWDLDSGSERRFDLHDRGGLHNIAFSPDGSALILRTGHVGTVLRLDPVTGERMLETEKVDSKTFAATCSPDGQLIAAGGTSGRVFFYDPVTGLVRGDMPLHAPHSIAAVAFTSSGWQLVVGDEAGGLHRWDAPPLQRAHDSGVFAVAFSSDAKWICSGDERGVVKVWRCDTGELSQHWKAHEGMIAQVAFADGDRRLVTSGIDGRICAWEPGSGKSIWRLSMPEGWTEGPRFAISADGRRLIASTGTTGVAVWDLERREQTMEFSGITSHVTLIKRDGSFASLKRFRAGFVTAELADGAQPTAWNTSGEATGGLAFCNANGLLAVALVNSNEAEASQIEIWELATSRLKQRLAGGVAALSFSRDGSTLAGSGNDRAVRVWSWDAETGLYTAVRTLWGHESEVPTLALSPDGHVVVSGGLDGTVRLWHVSTGEPLRAFNDTRQVQAIPFCNRNHRM